MRPSVALLLAVSALMGAFISSPLAQNPHETPHREQAPTLTVSGTGQVWAPPDLAVVRMGSVIQAPAAADAQKKASRIMHQTIEAIKALGISREMIRTSGISLWPIYERRGPLPERERPPRIIAYRARISMEVRVEDLSLAGAVIDAAMASGANKIMGVSFQLREEAPYKREALRKAALAAHEKAKAIANALGLEVARVVEISEGQVRVIQPMPRAQMALSLSKQPTPVEPGLIEVGARVSIRFLLRGTLGTP